MRLVKVSESVLTSDAELRNQNPGVRIAIVNQNKNNLKALLEL